MYSQFLELKGKGLEFTLEGANCLLQLGLKIETMFRK